MADDRKLDLNEPVPLLEEEDNDTLAAIDRGRNPAFLAWSQEKPSL
ncbi:MAG TPA: hypothetical protein VI685_02355 [Candidatus Angelobacter sp.]